MPKDIDNLNNSLSGYSDFIFDKLEEHGFNVTKINPSSLENYESLKNKLISGMNGSEEGIQIPALAIYFISSNYSFFELGSSDKLNTTITVGIELYTNNENQSRRIMDIIARETMSMEIDVSRPDGAYEYKLLKLEEGFSLLAEDETLFFGESIGIKVYTANTDINSVA